MKIALIGYGKMGRMVEKAALDQGYEIVAKIDPTYFSNTISEDALKEADVCIEFTNPNTVVENISKLAALGKNIIVGTTGWEHKIDEVREIITNYNIGLLYDSNFSIGMHLFMKILQEASSKIMPQGLYDIAGIESHHNQKMDAPSGTAKSIAKTIYQACGVEVPFTSVRCGSIPGTHTILFDSPVDTITFTHCARSREGFAQGTVTAASWIEGRKGFYTLSDMLFSGEEICSK